MLFINNYIIGSRKVDLSKKFKEINFKNKLIALAPYNNITKHIYNYIIENYSDIEVFFLDSNKNGTNIYNFNKDYDEVFLFSPNYRHEIIKKLNLEKTNLVYINLLHEITFSKYNFSSIFLYKIYESKKFIFNLSNHVRFKLSNKLNFLCFDNKKNLTRYKNIHKKRRAFIIGNGPSLTLQDLNKLKKEITFASNKIFLIFNETTWRPTYYSVEDSYDMAEYYDTIKNLKDLNIFLPVKHLFYHKRIKDAIYYPLISNHKNTYKCSDNLLEGIYPGCSVSYSMIQIALYMGVDEIFLLGIDFSYNVPKTQSGKHVLEHKHEINHFHKGYRKTGDKWLEPNIECQIQALKSAKLFAEKNGIKIYNASRKTKLDIFEKVNFDELF